MAGHSVWVARIRTRKIYTPKLIVHLPQPPSFPCIPEMLSPLSGKMTKARLVICPSARRALSKVRIAREAMIVGTVKLAKSPKPAIFQTGASEPTTLNGPL